MSGTRRALALILSAVLVAPTGCASAGKMQAPVVGRSVTVLMEEGDTKLKGELLLVEKDKLWVRARDGVREIPLAGVREVRVTRHGFGKGKAWTWAGVGAAATGGGLAAACSSAEGSDSCAGYGLVTAGLWLLVGGLAAWSLESSSRIDYPRPTADTLRPYTRLPQGLPPGVAPATLAATPPVAGTGKQ